MLVNENPEPISNFEPFYGLDIEPEMEYNNFTAYTEYEEYSKDVEKIKCYVQNNNKGKGFYAYNIVYAEKKIDGEWVRYSYDLTNLPELQTSWVFCGTEGEQDRCFRAILYLNVRRVSPKLDEGEYRIVAFLPTKDKSVQEVYAEFRITK